MKKYFAILFCLISIMFLFTACGKQPEEKTETYVIYYELSSDRSETLSITRQEVGYKALFTLYIPDIIGFEKWVIKNGENAGERFDSGTYLLESDIYLVAVFNNDFTTPDVPNLQE